MEKVRARFLSLSQLESLDRVALVSDSRGGPNSLCVLVELDAELRVLFDDINYPLDTCQRDDLTVEAQ